MQTQTTRTNRSATLLDLDRTQATRVAKAAQTLVERHGGSRGDTAIKLGFAKKTLQTIIHMSQPWRVAVDVLSRIEALLGLQSGDVLAGRAPEPQGEIGRQVRR